MEAFGHKFLAGGCIFCGLEIPWAFYASHGGDYGCSADEIIEQLLCEIEEG